MESAISVSSECRRGLELCRQSVFRWQMGSMAASLMTSISLSTPDTPLSAFMMSDEAAPSSVEVLPVTTVPSGSTMAPAGPPVVSSFSSAAERAGEMADRNAGLVHQQLQLLHLVLAHAAAAHLHRRL